MQRHAPIPADESKQSALVLLPFMDGGAAGAPHFEIALGLLGFALVAAGWLAFNHWRALGHLRKAFIGERRRAERFAAVLAAAPSGFWAWRAGDGDDAGYGGGALAQMLTVAPDSLSGFDDVLATLRREHGSEIHDLAARLRAEGTAFVLRVETADGRRVFEARGRRTAATPDADGEDSIWFRDITDAVREATRLVERTTALGAENVGLRQVLDGLQVPVWVRGADMNILYCNRAYARAVDEVAPAAAVAAAKEIAPGPGGWGQDVAAEALASKAPVTRSRHLVVGGQRRLFEITEFPIGGEDGAWRIAGIAIDRGDTDEARAELARHMAAHGEVLEKLGTGIIIFSSDTRVMFSNAAFAAMWGFDPDWLHGAPTHGELLEDLRARRMYPEQNDFQDFKRQRQELFTSLLDSHEELLHLPDERVMRVVISPHPQGGLMFTTEDVTDRLTLERSYNTLIAVQTETLDNLHEGVAVYGADAKLKLYNPAFARIWQLDPDLLDGEPRMVDVVDAARNLMRFEGDWGTFRNRLIANSSERISRGGRFERADGSILDYAAVPLPDGAMLFTYIDVTDSVAVQRALRERNEALLEADRLKSEFITNVSYELRTPLNTIIGFTEILSNQYFGTLNRRQSEYTRGVLEASQQLLALIDDILDLALIESGQLELDLAPMDARVMLDSVVSLSRERARKRELALELECADELGTLVMDERRIKQALFNLVSNAIKHTPPGGQITIAAAREDDALTITVSDTGAGIASADRERVFEKFERGADGEQHGGVGLGLALVKSFIDLHGGTVELDSALGRGTSVRVVLPLDQGGNSAGSQTA